MKIGDIISVNSGKYSCKYLVTTAGPRGYVLRRCITAKTKADANRFQNEISLFIEAHQLNNN